MLLQPFIRSPSAAQVSLLITSFLVAAARRARQYIPFDALSPRARQCQIVPCFLSPIVPLARARGVVLCVARAVARSYCGPWHRCMPRRGRSRWSRATRPSSTRLWEATSAAECRKLALDGDQHWRLRTLCGAEGAPSLWPPFSTCGLGLSPTRHVPLCQTPSLRPAGLSSSSRTTRRSQLSTRRCASSWHPRRLPNEYSWASSPSTRRRKRLPSS